MRAGGFADVIRDMPEQRVQPGTDRLIAALAARQYGVVSRDSAAALGRDAVTQIDERMRTRSVHSVHRGVYAVGHPRVAGSALVMAAVLACGEGAWPATGRAAALWGIRPSASRRSSHGAEARSQGARKGILLHRNHLDPADTTALDGIPVTTPARTLVDLADVLSYAGPRARLRRGRVPPPRLHRPHADPGTPGQWAARPRAQPPSDRHDAHQVTARGPLPRALRRP